ncbi:hypothetical protein J3D47_003476 [Pseudomonas laurylsulfativorans]|uniref:hypothetical protein n=1 Tax=Pseudomonas laurylsulfativorans TaxID=1943631 RepID=UPI00209CBFB2|nr:hypothetical protein [Pseudomonas laurylsulfativorans]MCP1419233.1 hypothetical protein [Pseudomonas laurylsulfativorans]
MSAFEQIRHFEDSRAAAGQQARVEDTRFAALQFRADMLKGPKARYFESFNLVKVPYPVRYGLRNAFSRERLVEYMHIQNRLFIVQFDTPQGVKTLLVSPSDHERNGETPFFRRLQDRTANWLTKILIDRQNTVPEILARIGLRPEDIDYITYDHLHTQDIRRWLGTDRQPGLFPNAKLLVHWREWESTKDLNPYQADWYCPSGIAGVPEDKVLCFDGSIMLGDGVALMHTPGHTEGNHSIVVHTDEGLWVTSENGVSVDAYAPLLSTASGVADYAKMIGTEVIINGNTLENAVDQYISMVQEATVAGPSKRDPRFPNVFPSSEMTPFWLFPGTRPAFYVGHARHGSLHPRRGV